MNSKIRWAVCGLGNISNRFYNVVSSIENAEVVCCVSSSKERAEEYKKAKNNNGGQIEFAYTYDELAKNASNVDAVYICTNMSDHCKNAIMFLNAKIPVLVEKSFAQNLKETKQMVDCAVANNTLLMEAMWTRLLPSTKEVIKTVNTNRLGKIKSINSYFSIGKGLPQDSRIFDKKRGGGSVLDLMVYSCSYCYNLCGNAKKSPPKEMWLAVLIGALTL